MRKKLKNSPKKIKKVISKEVQILKIDDIQRLTLLRIDADMRAVRATLTLKQGVLQSLLKQLDPSGQIVALQEDINSLQQNMVEHQTTMKTAAEGIGKKYGINLNEFVFDTETGALSKIGTSETKQGPVGAI